MSDYSAFTDEGLSPKSSPVKPRDHQQQSTPCKRNKPTTNELGNSLEAAQLSPFKTPNLEAFVMKSMAQQQQQGQQKPKTPDRVKSSAKSKFRKIVYLSDDDEDDDNQNKNANNLPRNAKNKGTKSSKFGSIPIRDKSAKKDDEDDSYFQMSQLNLGDFKSQNACELSQIRTQSGLFTYHHRAIMTIGQECCAQWRAFRHSEVVRARQFDTQSFAVIRDPALFNSLQRNLGAQLYAMVASTVNDSFANFAYPSTQNITFLRQFLRSYARLTVSNLGGGATGRQAFKTVSKNYLHFWRYFFTKIVPQNWKRRDVVELFRCPKSAKSKYFHDFITDLIENVLKSATSKSNEDDVERDPKWAEICDSYSTMNSLDPLDGAISRTAQFRFELLRIVCNFLNEDFERFLAFSSDYAADINNLVNDLKPLIVRLGWPGGGDDFAAKSNPRPDYLSHVLKYLVTFTAKCVKYRNPQVIKQLLTLITNFAEIVRLTSGNVRPYLEINSSRMSLAPYLVDEIVRELRKTDSDEGKTVKKRNDDSDLSETNLDPILIADSRWSAILGSMLDDLTPYHWFRVQVCLALLAAQFGINVARLYHKGKYRVSLRLLAYTFLVGDVDRFKFDSAEAIAKRPLPLLKQNNQTINATNETNQKANIVDEQKSQPESGMIAARRSKRSDMVTTASATTTTTGDEEYLGKMNRNAIEVMYRNFGAKGNLTSFGGNALHIAARRNDSNWIESLFELVDPNLADGEGRTPLIDASRCNHTMALEALIDSSAQSGFLLDYEATTRSTGWTALHFAVQHANEIAIRRLIEYGGLHLLKIRSHDKLAQTPEDMMQNEMRKRLLFDGSQAIVCRNPLNDVIPAMKFDATSQMYMRIVCAMIESYLDTVRLHKFALPGGDGGDKVSTQSFEKIFCRSATDAEMDAIRDDFVVLTQLSHHIDQFIQRKIILTTDSPSSAQKDNQQQQAKRKQSSRKTPIDYFRYLLYDIDCLIEDYDH